MKKTKQNRNKQTKNKNKQNIGVGATNLSQSSYNLATERHKVNTKIYLCKLVNTCIYLMGFEKGEIYETSHKCQRQHSLQIT